MAVNLRLDVDAEQALRERAAATGRSQQEILRAALNAYLGQAPTDVLSDLDALVARGRLRPPRTPYRAPTAARAAVGQMSTLDALERDDRL